MTTTLTLPFPISVNALYVNSSRGRQDSQRYATWKLEAGWELQRQRPAPVKGPVELLYEVQDGKDNRRRDLCNLEKGVTDLLVTHGVIEADHDLIVREVRMKWAKDVVGVRVTISPFVKAKMVA
jgi:Holliday junction resolvase RusA-like endonuclease